MTDQQITSRQRKAQKEKLDAAIKLLELAATETRTATPAEISGTVDVALEIVTKVNEFLKSRPQTAAIGEGVHDLAHNS